MPLYNDNGYVWRIQGDVRLAHIYAKLLRIVDELAVARHPAAGPVARVYTQLEAAYRELSIRGAAQADEFIRDRLEASISKTGRGRKSGNLARQIQSRPLPSTFPGGQIGIASLAQLNRAVDPRYPDYGSYWRVQEEGYSGFVGRRIQGYFSGSADASSGSRPDPNQRGAHPFFTPSARKGGRGTIQQPIEAKHYLRNGIRDYTSWHREQTDGIRGKAIESLASVRLV